MRSKPQIDSAVELFKFVLGFAGGKDGKHLIATDEFVRSHGHPSRVFLANKFPSNSFLLLILIIFASFLIVLAGLSPLACCLLGLSRKRFVFE